MEWYEFFDIAEKNMELINPCSEDKVRKIAIAAGMNENSRVLEFGCGFGEILRIWSQACGITGKGIEFRDYAVKRALKKMSENNLNGKIEIIHADGKNYEDKEKYDFLACIGASFIWGNFNDALVNMKKYLKKDGKILIGEPYWRNEPIEMKGGEEIFTELQLMDFAEKQGFIIECIVRGTEDDWDRYQSENWQGLLQWLEENPSHPDKNDVIKWLKNDQREYFEYVRAKLGWAIYLFAPLEQG